MNRKHFLTIGMILLCMPAFSNVNARQPADEKENVRLFVQKFYDWYTVLYSNQFKKKDSLSSNIVAINKKPEYFDIALRKALINDYYAQSKVTDDIVGLDFDPFLSGQEIINAYQTGNVKQVGNKFFVDIHRGVSKKSKAAILKSEIAVIAEVVKINDHWTFTNFIYPSKDGKSDLITILKNLRKDRSKNTK